MNKKPGKDAGFGEVMRCGCVNHESGSNALRRWERFYKRGNVGEILYGLLSLKSFSRLKYRF